MADCTPGYGVTLPDIQVGYSAGQNAGSVAKTAADALEVLLNIAACMANTASESTTTTLGAVLGYDLREDSDGEDFEPSNWTDPEKSADLSRYEPTRPTGFSYIAPSPVESPEVGTVDADVYAEFDDDQHQLSVRNYYGTPSNAPSLDFGTAPTLDVVELEPMPATEAPDSVTLSQTTVPTFAGLTLPSMAILINPANLPSLASTFNYAENLFSPTYLQSIVTETQRILGGATAIPSWVWDMIWSRAAGRLKRQELAELREAANEHASLGWDMPGVSLFARSAAARQKAREGINDLTREASVKEAEQIREDFWKALETNFAVEQFLHSVHNATQERVLKAAVESHNANIAAYNAALQAYQVTEIAVAEMQVKLKDLELRGSLAELQVFEAEIKAAGLALEYDKNQVELYKAQWSGQESKARAYAAYADALKAYVEQQKSAVEAYGISVQAQETKMKTWAIEWDAYVKRHEPVRLALELDKNKTAYYSAQVQKFLGDIQKESARIEAETKREQTKVARFTADVQQYTAQVQAEVARLDALAKIYSTEGQVYATAAQADATKIGAQVSTLQAEVEKYKAQASIDIEKAKVLASKLIAKMQAMAALAPTVSQVYSQLAGSAFSALHYSLSGSGDFNQSHSSSNDWSLNIGADASNDYSGSLNKI